MVVNTKDVLVIDIETVAGQKSYNELDERLQKQWDRKSSFFQNTEGYSSAEWYGERAGIFAEFGKIITIAVGFYTEHGDQVGLRVKALYNDDERKLLTDFLHLLQKFNNDDLTLCAHNGKEFDFPYICRRLLVHGLELPDVLNLKNKKPWEIKHIDTMEEWKFGDRKNFTSLDLLAALFNIESSKEGIDGSMVNNVYYEQNDLSKIATYCMHDVAVTAQLYLKMNNDHRFSREHLQLIE